MQLINNYCCTKIYNTEHFPIDTLTILNWSIMEWNLKFLLGYYRTLILDQILKSVE